MGTKSWGAALLLTLSGCMGEVLPGTPVESTPDAGGGPGTVALLAPNALGPSLLQRLTRWQLTTSLASTFGVTASVATADLAPLDSPSATYFENDAEALGFSLQLITEYEQFAWSYAFEVRQQPAAFIARAGCTPSGPGDATCLRAWALKVGRLALRRPVTGAEVDGWVASVLPAAQAENDFFVAVELLTAMWLQHPEVLYRVEAGDPQANAPTPLTGPELATRVSFLVTGLPPDDVLLDAAERGTLSTAQGRATQVQRLLATPQGITHAQRLHARWLGFAERFFPASLAADALAETNALVEQVAVDPQRDWLSLFTADETFVTPALAQHYGLPSPGMSAGWVKLPAGRAAGVLSQATFAALGAKFGDTSPTLRGYETVKRLLCGSLVGDIPDGVDVTMPPGTPGACKPQRYTMRTTVGCSQCHAVMDPVGLGLEQLGPYGEWRGAEPSNAACGISGEGELTGTPFTGPEALGRLLHDDPRVTRCATKQLFESMNGRKARPADEATVEALRAQYLETRSYGSLLVALAKSPSFALKTSR